MGHLRRRGHRGMGNLRRRRHRCVGYVGRGRHRRVGHFRRPVRRVGSKLRRAAALCDLKGQTMRKWLCVTLLNPIIALGARPWRRAQVLRDDTGWTSLPPAAQMYVATVTLTGVVVMARFFPTTCSRPWMLASLIAFSCITSLWKVTLPLGFTSGSTLSVSYAADLMALLLLGPNHAMVVAVAGAWTQCTFRAKEPYPWYRTAFSVAAEAITMQATGVVYGV